MSKLSPSDTSAAARPADSAALHGSSQQPGREQHGRRISRVMLLQRELNDKPVPVPRPSAPTASAVARASEALRARGVEPVGPDCTDHVDLVLVLGGDGVDTHSQRVRVLGHGQDGLHVELRVAHHSPVPDPVLAHLELGLDHEQEVGVVGRGA